MLALSLPRVDEVFLEGFSRGLYALADEHAVDLVGGDTTAGPLAMTITAFGEVPEGKALLRRGAQPEDDLWVSGTLGDARLALEVFRGRARLGAEAFEAVRLAMECPVPRVALGQALRDVASAAIDISDGLLGDLGHILRRSGTPQAPLGAALDAAAVPISPFLAAQPNEMQLDCALGGGDDYELCFTARPQRRDAVLAAASSAGVPVTRVGRIDFGPDVRIHGRNGERLDHAFASFDHFRA
jgi:thiamine-monophosphate kinase